jgi:hypothetical protein
MVDRVKSHRQVPAKVTAYVDEDIKELVEVLNTFDGLWSSESCQGYEGEMVCIDLHYDAMKNYRFVKTAEFVKRLAEVINQVAIDEMGLICHSIYLSLEWSGDMRFPSIVIRCSQADIKEVTKVFCSVRRRLG